MGRLDRTGAMIVAVLLALTMGCSSAKQAQDQRLRRAAAHYDLGVDYLSRGNTAMAVRELQTSLGIEEQAPRVHHALAEAFRAIGRLPDAVTHMRRALELDPDFQGARLSYSALLVQMEDYDGALRESQRLLEDPTFPAPWRALTNAGWAEYKLGRVEAARESLRKALAMHGNYWPAQLNLGILEADAGRRAEALDRFSRVLAAKPGPMAEAETNYRMAELYVSLGERDRALSHLSAVLERTPEGEWAARSQSYRSLLK